MTRLLRDLDFSEDPSQRLDCQPLDLAVQALRTWNDSVLTCPNFLEHQLGSTRRMHLADDPEEAAANAHHRPDVVEQLFGLNLVIGDRVYERRYAAANLCFPTIQGRDNRFGRSRYAKPRAMNESVQMVKSTSVAVRIRANYTSRCGG